MNSSLLIQSFTLYKKQTTHKQCKASKLCSFIGQTQAKLFDSISCDLINVVCVTYTIYVKLHFMAPLGSTAGKTFWWRVILIFISERKNFIQFQTKKYSSLAYWIHSEAILVCGWIFFFFFCTHFSHTRNAFRQIANCFGIGIFIVCWSVALSKISCSTISTMSFVFGVFVFVVVFSLHKMFRFISLDGASEHVTMPLDATEWKN